MVEGERREVPQLSCCGCPLHMLPQGVACAGLAADGRAIVSRAMAEANNYK